jgi:hypothetical protein
MCPAHRVEPLEPWYFYDAGFRVIAGAIWVLTKDHQSCTESQILSLLLRSNRYTQLAEFALLQLRKTPYTSRRELAEHRAAVVDAYERRKLVRCLREMAARAEAGWDLETVRTMLTDADVWGTNQAVTP